MLKKKIFYGVMLASLVGFINQGLEAEVEAQNATYRQFVGCTALTTAQKEAINANFDERLKMMGLPKTITDPYGRAGVTHSINKDYMINDCLVVYGSASSVPSNVDYPGTNNRQTYNSSGRPIFIGFDQDRRLFPSIIDQTAPPDELYFTNRYFIKYPWTTTAKAPGASQTLAQSIAESTVKPKPRSTSYASTNSVDGVYLTERQELARINDFIYWQYSSTRSRGKIGYLRSSNTKTGITWNADRLYEYASVEYFPKKYTPGRFNIYTYDSRNDTYYFSNHIIPQHSMALRDFKPNLKIEITGMSSTTIKEGKNNTINYKITNTGPFNVTNPVVSYYVQGGTVRTITHSSTMSQGATLTGAFTVTAGTVSANKVERVFVEVNKNASNPRDEETRTDNIDSEYFGIVNNVNSGTFKITYHTPFYPRSNQTVTPHYQICNTGNVAFTNVQTYLNWPGKPKVAATLFPSIAPRTETYDPATKTFKTTPGECVTGSTALTAADTGEIEKKLTLSGTTNNSAISEGTRVITIRNPNASLRITNPKQSTGITEKELGDIKATVTNNMFRTVTNDCVPASDCEPGGQSSKFTIRFFDVTNPSSPVEVTAAAFTGTYSLTHTKYQTFTLGASKTALENYIQANGKKITKFRVLGYIPYYKGEYDTHGAPMYEDNKVDMEIQYLPPRPVVTNAVCKLIDHQVGGFFVTNGGPSLVKICMGHYPNNPSTLVEQGMQSYNYVLYRFHPMPMPKYTIYSPSLNESDPNYFYQILSTPNDNRERGVQEAYVFKTFVDGAWEERGRNLPTKVDMRFDILNITGNVSTGKKVVAAGNVSYTIPPGCYERDKLDLKYHYGCGEIMVFLPNSQARMLEIPANYNQTDVENRNISYPIANTKIPYLNTGKYQFKLAATETYKYYYQTNDSYDAAAYNWSIIKTN